MAKESGLGDNFYIGGYNISNDVGSLGSISAPMGVHEMPGIDVLAMERVGGLRSGHIEFTSYLNTSAGQAHEALKSLPLTNRIATYARGTTLGAPAYVLQGKQLNYDWTRAADGALTENVTLESDQYGGEWGIQLTAGVRTDTTATSPATGVDTTASLSFGIQAYLQVFSFTGTSVTITVQDSADNSSFANISGLSAFTVVSAAPATERIASSNTTTVRRYLRVITAGTFSSAAFSVVVVKNPIAGQVF
jgi:hypothetical protein